MPNVGQVRNFLVCLVGVNQQYSWTAREIFNVNVTRLSCNYAYTDYLAQEKEAYVHVRGIGAFPT
jgi:hypothetical protein